MKNLLEYRQLMIGLLVFVAIAIAWLADSAVRTVDTGVALGVTVLVLGDMVIEKKRK